MDNNYQNQPQNSPFDSNQPNPIINNNNNNQNFQQQNNDIFQGQNNHNQQPTDPNEKQKADKKATTALITAIVGLFICAPVEIFALIYGVIALKNNTNKRGMATASIIISIIGIIIWICSLFFILPTL